jgi:hypothetical protein
MSWKLWGKKSEAGLLYLSICFRETWEAYDKDSLAG